MTKIDTEIIHSKTAKKRDSKKHATLKATKEEEEEEEIATKDQIYETTREALESRERENQKVEAEGVSADAMKKKKKKKKKKKIKDLIGDGIIIDPMNPQMNPVDPTDHVDRSVNQVPERTSLANERTYSSNTIKLIESADWSC